MNNIGHYRKENCVQAHRREVDGGYKDKENRERGTNNNGKAMGNKYTAHWANKIIIVVAVVCPFGLQLDRRTRCCLY